MLPDYGWNRHQEMNYFLQWKNGFSKVPHCFEILYLQIGKMDLWDSTIRSYKMLQQRRQSL